MLHQCNRKGVQRLIRKKMNKRVKQINTDKLSSDKHVLGSGSDLSLNSSYAEIQR